MRVDVKPGLSRAVRCQPLLSNPPLRDPSVSTPAVGVQGIPLGAAAGLRMTAWHVLKWAQSRAPSARGSAPTPNPRRDVILSGARDGSEATRAGGVEGSRRSGLLVGGEQGRAVRQAFAIDRVYVGLCPHPRRTSPSGSPPLRDRSASGPAVDVRRNAPGWRVARVPQLVKRPHREARLESGPDERAPARSCAHPQPPARCHPERSPRRERSDRSGRSRRISPERIISRR